LPVHAAHWPEPSQTRLLRGLEELRGAARTRTPHTSIANTGVPRLTKHCHISILTKLHAEDVERDIHRRKAVGPGTLHIQLHKPGVRS